MVKTIIAECKKSSPHHQLGWFLIAQPTTKAYDFPGEQPGDNSLDLHGIAFPVKRQSMERRRSPGHRGRGISSASTTPPKEGDRDPESPPRLREMGEVVYH
jgi:hypothetical protein